MAPTLTRAAFMSAVPRRTEYAIKAAPFAGETVTLKVLSEAGRQAYNAANNRTSPVYNDSGELTGFAPDPDPNALFIFLRETVEFADGESLTVGDIDDMGGLEGAPIVEISNAAWAWNGNLFRYQTGLTTDPNDPRLRPAPAKKPGDADGEGAGFPKRKRG